MKISDHLYKLIADEATMAIVVARADGALLYSNSLAQNLFEFQLEQNAGPGSLAAPEMKIQQFFPEENADRKMRRFSTELLEMQGFHQEVMVKKLNNQIFVATLGIKHIEIQNERCFLLMFQDITIQKKLQRELTEKQSAIHQAFQELLSQNKKLVELDLAKNRFIAITTHELRTPLSAIHASAEILKNKLYDTPEQHDEFLNMIYDQSIHMLSLVNDILDFAKIQANKMDYYIEEKDIVQICKLETEALQAMAEAAHVTLEMKATQAPLLCYFDEVRIKQVLANLMNNAIKYNVPNGRVTLETEVTQNYINIYIHDTGKGIAEEDLPKIFDEFETLGKVANHSKGTGLGLSISQRMIRSMGGEIYLKSTVGAGSTFWVSIPRERILKEEVYRRRPGDDDDIAA